MDKSEHYRDIVRNLLKRDAENFPHHGQIRTLPISDEKNDKYLLMDDSPKNIIFGLR